MGLPTRILIVDDSPDDVELIVRTLRRGGRDVAHMRVDTADAMQAALAPGDWDLIIADYTMPRFNGIAALKLLRQEWRDLPFILVSGTMGEDVAVEAMKAGANDYILKSNLSRLPHAVERELRDAQLRRDRRMAEERYRNLFDQVPLGIFSVTPEGDLLEANPAFVAMLGFADAEELKRINLETLWVDPAERARLMALIGQEGVVRNFEMRLRRRDGGVIWCLENARAAYRPASPVDRYESVCVDITERKRMEHELAQSSQEFKGLVLTASDRLQDAMRAVTGGANLLAQRCRGALDDAASEHLTQVLWGVSRMEQIVSGLRTRAEP
jgi:two-component system, NarL family, sensor histidine kinase UhpB